MILYCKSSKMKRTAGIFAACLSLCFLLASCKKNEPDFDENLLLGRWVEGTEYYRYDNGHTGATWDTGEDVSEDEALPFTWSLSGNRLIHYHTMEGGQVVPQAYTMTRLSSQELKYHDNAGAEHSFTKVN